MFREAPDVVLQKDVIEDPRYLGLHKQDRTKVGLNVSFFLKINKKFRLFILGTFLGCVQAYFVKGLELSLDSSRWQRHQESFACF